MEVQWFRFRRFRPFWLQKSPPSWAVGQPDPKSWEICSPGPSPINPPVEPSLDQYWSHFRSHRNDLCGIGSWIYSDDFQSSAPPNVEQRGWPAFHILPPESWKRPNGIQWPTGWFWMWANIGRWWMAMVMVDAGIQVNDSYWSTNDRLIFWTLTILVATLPVILAEHSLLVHT